MTDTLFDLEPMIADIGETEATRRRFPVLTENDISNIGTVSPGTPVDTQRMVAIHDTGRRTLQRMGISDFSIRRISIYDREIAYDADSGRTPDQWLYEGRWFEVFAIGDYLRSGGICLIHAQQIDGGNK